MNTNSACSVARNAALIGVVFGAVGLQRSQAGNYDVIDQSQDEVDIVFGIPARGTLGQRFNPDRAEMHFVELAMFDATTDPNGGSAFVRVREGTLDGNILGTSETVFLEDCFQFPGGPGCGMAATQVAQVRFDFPEPILFPGTPNPVFEVVHAGGDPLGVAFASRNPYLGGHAFVEGAANFDLDLTFREGIVVPEPASVALIGLGLIVTSLRRRRPC